MVSGAARERALDTVLAVVAAERVAHASAIGWAAGLPWRPVVAWLPSDWVSSPAGTDVLAAVEPGLSSPPPGMHPRRWAQAATDRLTLAAAVALLMRPADRLAAIERGAISLSRDALGKPVAAVSDPLARCLPPGDLHVSFTHDGHAHICLTACAPDLRGIGVDAVWLQRLRRPAHTVEHLMALASRFMAAREYRVFAAECSGAGTEAVSARLAAHFSLMEAASKAVGTGLLLGGGIGRRGSLPPAELGVLALTPEVDWLLGSQATARLSAIGASSLAGVHGADREYVVSAAASLR